ncbi:putative F-box protein PP2-B12 [Lotus japonicus]|uniref:putative F-box protein PP2-B12 n=1 Tax=Lotus japonicus TaxID=34305 RepID=UPI00258BCD3D|nr:putative F-box protein PP2-B12 [Lotus japonicus]XP_057433612.1 putative F-box protein PP2-B12 [Lotus japonicus]XP_057433613.1 putative F-box protein PP2-B12 [Lotus japonicus]
MESMPEGCIAAILSRTTPVDAARISLVSKVFRSAADSDAVWDRFLPSDSHSIVSQSPSRAKASSKKAFYLDLSDHPVVIDDGKKSFQLKKKSGKKCFMLGAKALFIAWDNGEHDWSWTTLPESRFPEVGVLRHLCWLEIHGMINTFSLSPNTLYGAFLVFKIIDVVQKFLVVLAVRKIGSHIMTKIAYLNPDSLEREAPGRFSRVRSDDWLEIEMGEFFNSGLEDDEVQMSVVRLDGCWNTSLIIEGIEVRPKDDN